MITTFENICVLKFYVIVLIPIFNTAQKGKKQVKIYMWYLHHELVLLQQSRNCFCYVPDNDIEGDILGWTTSYSQHKISSSYITFGGMFYTTKKKMDGQYLW